MAQDSSRSKALTALLQKYGGPAAVQRSPEARAELLAIVSGADVDGRVSQLEREIAALKGQLGREYGRGR
jgi:uncharacterized small protein (DUF1192 family)